MKRIERDATAETTTAGTTSSATTETAPKPGTKVNGHNNVEATNGNADLGVILASLQTMRDGDFSVRLPGYWTGLHGKIADTFNDIVFANQQMARELTRVGQAVGKEGRTSERTRFHESRAPGVRWKFRSIPWWKTCCVPRRK